MRTVVVINEENILVLLWRIAALNNVVRLTRNDDSGHARHVDNLPLAGLQVNENDFPMTVPIYSIYSVFGKSGAGRSRLVRS